MQLGSARRRSTQPRASPRRRRRGRRPWRSPGRRRRRARRDRSGRTGRGRSRGSRGGRSGGWPRGTTRPSRGGGARAPCRGRGRGPAAARSTRARGHPWRCGPRLSRRGDPRRRRWSASPPITPCLRRRGVGRPYDPPRGAEAQATRCWTSLAVPHDRLRDLLRDRAAAELGADAAAGAVEGVHAHGELRLLRLVGLAVLLPAHGVDAAEPHGGADGAPAGRRTRAQGRADVRDRRATSRSCASSSTTGSSCCRCPTGCTGSAWTCPCRCCRSCCRSGSRSSRSRRISYVMDVFRRQTPAARRWSTSRCCMSFFPHLVAGPIVRATRARPAVRASRRDPRSVDAAARVLADRDGAVQEGRGRQLRWPPSWSTRSSPSRRRSRRSRSCSAIYGYAVQIYADFSRLHRHRHRARAAARLPVPAELRPALHRRCRSRTSGAAGT